MAVRLGCGSASTAARSAPGGHEHCRASAACDPAGRITLRRARRRGLRQWFAGAYAATFYGPAVVSGDFTVVGGAKSAAVPHPDGSHRRLYCVESPESWFEDFGEGRLVCSEASIALDPDFAAVVDTTKYHVFLTGLDGVFDLSAADKTPEGFRVRAATGTDGTFAWRVVAKRKDIAAPRFEHVAIPREPTLPQMPLAAARPEHPERT